MLIHLANDSWTCLFKLPALSGNMWSMQRSQSFPIRPQQTSQAPEMKSVFAEEHQDEFSVKAICRVLGVCAAAGIPGGCVAISQTQVSRSAAEVAMSSRILFMPR